LLLDEIFAELDEHRTEALIGAFGKFDQLFLTTASRPPEALVDKASSFRIHNGTIEETGK
jgi:recombinational DNA repair ATPase RecF